MGAFHGWPPPEKGSERNKCTKALPKPLWVLAVLGGEAPEHPNGATQETVCAIRRYQGGWLWGIGREPFRSMPGGLGGLGGLDLGEGTGSLLFCLGG